MAHSGTGRRVPGWLGHYICMKEWQRGTRDRASVPFEGACTFKDFERRISLMRSILYKGHSGQSAGEGRKTCQEAEIGTGLEMWKEHKQSSDNRKGVGKTFPKYKKG